MITPYAKTTTITLWTDPYISKNMLEAHLDPNTDAASRKPETIQKTCDFVETLLSPGSSIADFGCGPGLYTDIYQQKGFEVVGIDISKNSLEYARKKNPNVEYLKMNYRENHLKKPVDFIQMIYCDFGAMSPFAQKHTLDNIKKSLKPKGLFYFDTFNELFFKKAVESYNKEEVDGGFYMPGKQTITTKRIKYDRMQLLLTHIQIEGKRDMEFFNYDKCYSVKEMKILLEDNGFEIVDYYSDSTGKKNYDDSETYAFLCRVI